MSIDSLKFADLCILYHNVLYIYIWFYMFDNIGLDLLNTNFLISKESERKVTIIETPNLTWLEYVKSLPGIYPYIFFIDFEFPTDLSYMDTSQLRTVSELYFLFQTISVFRGSGRHLLGSGVAFFVYFCIGLPTGISTMFLTKLGVTGM